MTLLELYNRLGKLKNQPVPVLIAPERGAQHLEEIVDVDFVQEVGAVVICCKEKK